MYLVYCDDSGESKCASPFKSMCALIMKDEDFRLTEGYMGHIVHAVVPEEKREGFEFHASELFNGYGPFEGITREQAHRIFEMCVDAVRHDNSPIIYSYVDLNTLRKNIFASAVPLDIAFRLCLPEIERWFVEKAPKDFGMLICDDTTERKIKEKLQDTFTSKRCPAKSEVHEYEGKSIVIEDRGELDHLHDSMYFGSSKHSRGIQLADVCSYIIKRHNDGCEETEYLYKQLEPSIFSRKDEPRSLCGASSNKLDKHHKSAKLSS